MDTRTRPALGDGVEKSATGTRPLPLVPWRQRAFTHGGLIDEATTTRPGVGESRHTQRVDTVEPKFLEGACRQSRIYKVSHAENMGTGALAPIFAK